jgi:hypothetical protein
MKKKIKILYCEVIKNGLSKDPVNNPYIVDIIKLEEILDEFNKTVKKED